MIYLAYKNKLKYQVDTTNISIVVIYIIHIHLQTDKHVLLNNGYYISDLHMNHLKNQVLFT